MPAAAARWPYNRAYHTLYRWNRSYHNRKTLGIIRSMDELIAKLETEKGKENLEYFFNKEKSTLKWTEVAAGQARHLVIWDPDLMNHTKSSKVWHIDATYRAIPRIFKARQLLTIMGRVNNEVYFY